MMKDQENRANFIQLIDSSHKTLLHNLWSTSKASPLSQTLNNISQTNWSRTGVMKIYDERLTFNWFRFESQTTTHDSKSIESPARTGDSINKETLESDSMKYDSPRRSWLWNIIYQTISVDCDLTTWLCRRARHARLP